MSYRYRDPFDGPDGAPGPNWDVINGVWQIAGNRLRQTVSGNPPSPVGQTILWAITPNESPDAVYIQARLTKPADANWVTGLTHKYRNVGGAISFYHALIKNISPGADEWKVYRYSGTLASGTYTQLGATYVEEFIDDSFVRFQYVDGTLRLRLRDGAKWTDKLVIQDSTLAGIAGAVGFRTNTANGVSFADFEFGSLDQSNWMRGNRMNTLNNKAVRSLLPSAARTANTATPKQNDPYAGIARAYLNVTAASGTGGLTVVFRGYDRISGNVVELGTPPAAVTATGLKTFLLDEPLPVDWDVLVKHGDASSYTYSLSVETLR